MVASRVRLLFILSSIPHNDDQLLTSISIDLSLEQYKGKWLILGFIPMAWTFVWFVPLKLHHQLTPTDIRYSPTEIIAFSDAAKQFEERGASVVFASTDSEYSLLSWAQTARKDGGLGSIQIPLLSDKNLKISREYGVLLEEEGIALRGLFIIDPSQKIRQVRISNSWS